MAGYGGSVEDDDIRPAPFEITNAVSRDQCRLIVSGELDLASAPELEGAVARVCCDGTSSVVLDLGGVSFVDSTGLRSVLNARRLCEQHSYAFAVGAELQPPVARVLEMTGLIDRLPVELSGVAH